MGRFQAAGGRLPATFDSNWEPTARYECLTGTVQLGGVWLRLFQLTGEARYREAGLRRSSAPPDTSSAPAGRRSTARSGLIPGVRTLRAAASSPNWATKFLADSLRLREQLSA